MGERDCYLGVDLGGTKILAASVSKDGQILARAKRPTPFRSRGGTLLRALSEATSEALKSAELSSDRIVALGMGSPGPLDPEKGVILRTPNIAVRNLPVARLLSKEFGVPVVLDNDVHMGVYGEFRAGAAKGYRNLIGLWVGTGIGGCVIWDGRVLHGTNRNAGEIGHMVLDAKGAAPGNERGSLEWHASKTGLARRLAKEVKKGRKTSLAKAVKGGEDRLKSGDLAEAYEAGDEVAQELVERSARYVGIAIANLFDAFAPELFVLGGGVVEAIGKPYVASVQKAADEHAFTTELGKVKIVASRLGDDAGVLGAALAASERYPASG